MTLRQIAITVPDQVLLAEKTDEAGFAREVLMLAAGVFVIKSVFPRRTENK